MEVDKTVVAVGVVLLVVLGIFALSQVGGASSGDSIVQGSGYAAQYAGGGCGR